MCTTLTTTFWKPDVSRRACAATITYTKAVYLNNYTTLTYTTTKLTLTTKFIGG